MAQSKFRSYEPDQVYLLPPSLNEWLPEDHLAYFIMDVVKELDLQEIYDQYDSREGGQPAYDPRMMVGLLLLGYCVGIFSSRKMEKATYEWVPFRVIGGDQHPDHDTIAHFRKRHLAALGKLFTQVLRLCQKAKLVKLGHIALDGTKVHANASKHKAMSYERMQKSEQELEREIEKLLSAAQAQDDAEDQQFGKGMRGDELPEELRFKQRRLAKIREAKEALEREAQEKAEEKAREGAKRGGKKGNGGGKGKSTEVKPKPKAQRNFTDPDSRIMIDKAANAFQQSYNCQAAVDGEAQVIVAVEVTQEANDLRQLVPMAERIRENTGGKLPKALSADNGYFNGDHIRVLEKMTNLLVATEKEKHIDKKGQSSPRGRPPVGLTMKQRMRRKLCTKTGRLLYSKRKEIVEPVFGQIKEARKFRQFLLRGLENVGQEWSLVCTTHNLLKLHRSGWAPC